MADKTLVPASEIKHVHSEIDVPLRLEKNHVEEDWTAEEDRKLVIDLRILPYLSVIFGLSLLDLINVSAAYIAGMSTDIELSVGARYSMSLLFFFITYVLLEITSNLIIRRVGARWWLSFPITAWGICVICMGFIQSWVPLVVLRVLLRALEAGLLPGAVFLISAWYKTYETARRVSWFYMASLMASGFNGIVRSFLASLTQGSSWPTNGQITYGLSLIRSGSSTYRQGWGWILLIEGAITIFCDLTGPICLGEFPEHSKWLNERERYIATIRLANERSGREYEHPTLRQGLRLLMDWKVAFYCLQAYLGACSVYALGYYMPIILRQGLGFSYALAQILSSPPYLTEDTIARLVGLVIVLYAKPPGVRLFGVFLAIFGTNANVPGNLTYGQGQTALPHKKGLVAAAQVGFGSIGGITDSTIFRSQDAPQYFPGMWATISFQILYIVMTCGMSLWLTKRNRDADEKGEILEKVEGFRYAP
ncbi:pantothenate transporter [Fonsecaea pedrosoi]|nr:pantothenate transporter [Fonsecaea pedrosoi]